MFVYTRLKCPSLAPYLATCFLVSLTYRSRVNRHNSTDSLETQTIICFVSESSLLSLSQLLQTSLPTLSWDRTFSPKLVMYKMETIMSQTTAGWRTTVSSVRFSNHFAYHIYVFPFLLSNLSYKFTVNKCHTVHSVQEVAAGGGGEGGGEQGNTNLGYGTVSFSQHFIFFVYSVPFLISRLSYDLPDKSRKLSAMSF